MEIPVSYQFSDYCVCPECCSELVHTENALRCSACQKIYEIRNGIVILLPEYTDKEQDRYKENYEQIAKNFISTDKYSADNVAFRHDVLLEFIGRNKRGKRVLDIGSSHGLYLAHIDADLKVAFDIAMTYLRRVKASTGIVPVQGDAEYLPFKPGFFDVIIVADILEHLLHPERLLEKLMAICAPETQVFVHIPWEENLESYRSAPFEFTHVRSFNAYTFSAMWRDFYIKRSRFTYPDLRYPFVFRLDGRIPRLMYNALVWGYFFLPRVATKDAEWRQRRLEALPRGERRLLWFFRPVFRIFEMRRRNFKSSWWFKIALRVYHRFSGQSGCRTAQETDTECFSDEDREGRVGHGRNGAGARGSIGCLEI